MLDSESKFEKVQGIWFDDIDWGVDVSYDRVGNNEKAENDCVYLDSGGYAYGCKKVNGRDGNGNQGTAFQRRIGKEKIALQDNGWGIMVGKVSFVVGLIEMVKGDGNGEESFNNKWKEWFEKGNDGKGKCLEVTRKDKNKRGTGEGEYEYKPKKCKWKLKGEKKEAAVSVFKKVFADEPRWAKKSFKNEHMKNLCGEKNWNADNFGGNKEMMGTVKNKFISNVCGGKSWKEEGYVENWDTNGSIKVIEGQVFEFGKGRSNNGELLAFEREGEGQDIFGGEEKGETGGRGVSPGDWLKSARWDGKMSDQSCSSVEQWNTRFDAGAKNSRNDCLSSEGGNEKKSNKWLHDQSWEDIKKKFGFGKKSEKNECQWLMKEPFTGRGHEDLRPEHTMVMGFRLEVLSLITLNNMRM
ncbi:hypothetical protein MSUIS_06470 [Mycoplasma suis KI3806]|uniref:Uncharacterized protein n=1 Tax=Mycoplasma suis (strain KI_3806) TaxID=708248 RepID=F0V259_MYCS3|nr:hypothetical protein [Mycoplasma suis]CBZ40740.1 hypothetical protein MSUIS_06470 [Mycoplasma suis KI3806]